MTREEAILLIKSAQLMLVNPKTNEPISDLYAALDMAIKALENKPRFLVNSDGKIEQIIEPCDDCVSRQAVLDALDNHKYSNEFCEEHHIDWSINLGMAHIVINELPPVLPKRKQGEWCEQNDDYFDWYECSECGYGSEGEMQYSSEHDVRTKYCPNCGAKMEGGAE